MIREYIQEAMNLAKYELLEDGEGFYGEIPECPGVYANADNLEACRRDLESVLEGWLLVRISRNMDIPTISGVNLLVEKTSVA